MITLKTFAPSAQVFAELQRFAVVVQTGKRLEIVRACDALAQNPLFAGKGWQANIEKFASVVIAGKAKYKVFAMGNSKLPFLAYSTLPIVTCPGAGECLNFCYSVTAWRYPAAFFRQCQNAFLTRFHKSEILAQLDNVLNTRKMAKLDKVDFRLFVDGDFDSIETLQFWMDAITTRSKLNAYGYSKSFALFVEYAKQGRAFPINYMVNLSNGHNASEALESEFAALPVVRGAFKAVNVGYNVKAAMHGTKEHNANLRKAYGQKAFTCPGKCGECTPSGHACGSEKFKGIDIIIAVH